MSEIVRSEPTDGHDFDFGTVDIDPVIGLIVPSGSGEIDEFADCEFWRRHRHD